MRYAGIRKFARLPARNLTNSRNRGLLSCDGEMSAIDPTIQDEAVRILRSLYPEADPYEFERNLYFPLKRCLSIQSDICSGFPECMCGRDVIAATFGDHPPPPASAGARPQGGSSLF